MIEIAIQNDDIGLNALDWCNDNLSWNEWHIESNWPSTRLTFRFSDSKIATLFALKWL
jgi:hypothetical protein